jgi:tetratricopeptide (TPR) repeat protein
MLAAADVAFHSGPSLEAPVADNPTGGALTLSVDAADGDWLQIEGSWVQRSDVTSLEAAIEFFSAQLERKPTPFSLTSRAVAWKERSEFDKARADVQEAIRIDPKFALAYAVRAELSFLGGSFNEGLRDCDKALTLDPRLRSAQRSRTLALDLLSLRYGNTKFRDAAAIPLRDSYKLEVDDRRSKAIRLFNGAEQTRRNGDHRKAIVDLEEAVRLAPELRTATFFALRGHQYSMLMEYDKAKADLREALSLEPKNVHHYQSLALICSAQDDLDGAIDQYARAYELNNARENKTEKAELPDRTVAIRKTTATMIQSALLQCYVARARQRWTKGDLAAATEDFDHAISLDPKSPFARCPRALFLADQGEFERALNDCELAIANNPKSSYVWCNRGVVYQMQGDFAKAIEAFNQAVQKFPLETAPLLARGKALAASGDFNNALDDMNRAISLEPGNASCYLERAQIFQQLKRGDEAGADLMKAKELIGAPAKPLRRPSSNSSGACSSSCFFQAITWLGWTWNFPANSAVVLSPRTAANATCDLKVALNTRRFLLIKRAS